MGHLAPREKVASLSNLPFLPSRARAAGPSRGIPSNRAGESHRILLEDRECEIVLRHEDVDRRSQEILARYRIPADRSPDLLALKSSPTVDPPTTVNTEETAEANAGGSPDEASAIGTSAASQ